MDNFMLGTSPKTAKSTSFFYLIAEFFSVHYSDNPADKFRKGLFFVQESHYDGQVFIVFHDYCSSGL